MGAVSPAALLMDSIAPVAIPGRALGRTIFHMVCHFVAPKAKLASLNDIGTALKPSSAAVITMGKTRMERVKIPASKETPKWNSITKTAKPKSP